MKDCAVLTICCGDYLPLIADAAVKEDLRVVEAITHSGESIAPPPTQTGYRAQAARRNQVAGASAPIHALSISPSMFMPMNRMIV